MLNNRLQSATQLQTLTPTTTTDQLVGIVYDIILDSTHPLIKQSEESYLIGGIKFRFINDISSDESYLSYAHPISENEKNLPTRNEIVEIYQFNGMYFYRRIGYNTLLNTTAEETAISSIFKQRDLPTNKDYKKVQKTGIERSSNGNDTDTDGFGKYFKPEENIHRLRLNEGDYLFESRFGQSIRFSAYNNDSHLFSPTVILRNRENEITRQESLSDINEDLIRDGSIIAMLSNQYQLQFIPGSVEEGGSSDFETKPVSFKNYPDRLIGDQIFISSGRIILSAKESEMIFYSKKNYGFISDGGLSIDNKLGIDVSVGSNINVATNDYNINFNIRNGKINLGQGNGLQPVVKGDDLKNALEQLIDLISQQVFLTPSGPTSPGPTNVAMFNNLKARLNAILSTQIKTV